MSQPMTPQHHPCQLADQLLIQWIGYPLYDWIQDQLDAEQTYKAMSDRITDFTGVLISAETLQQWKETR